jgi:hypothetical protein
MNTLAILTANSTQLFYGYRYAAPRFFSKLRCSLHTLLKAREFVTVAAFVTKPIVTVVLSVTVVSIPLPRLPHFVIEASVVVVRPPPPPPKI